MKPSFIHSRRCWSDETLLLAALCRMSAATPSVNPGLDWRRLLLISQEERISNLAYANLRKDGMINDIPSDVVDEMSLLYEAVLQRTILVNKELSKLLSLFESASIRCMPIKGAFMARHIYDDAGVRDMGDIDILVPPEAGARAAQLLRDRGYDTLDEVEEEGDYVNSSILIDKDSIFPIPIHLHWHIVNASLSLSMYRRAIDMEEMWRESRPVAYDRAHGYAPAPHHLICHLAEHAMKHSFSHLVLVADVVSVFDRFASGTTSGYLDIFPSLDLPKIADCARRWNLRHQVYYTLVIAEEIFGLHVDRALLSAVRPRCQTIWDRALINALRENRRRDGLSFWGLLAAAEDIRGQFRFLWESAFPSRRAMRSFGKEGAPRNYLARLSRGITMIKRSLA